MTSIGDDPALLPGHLADEPTLWGHLARHASCAGARLEPDAWFPVSGLLTAARQEAAAALGVCSTCPVRVPCLALSLRNRTVGRYGIWGGLLPDERLALHELLGRLPSRAAAH